MKKDKIKLLIKIICILFSILLISLLILVFFMNKEKTKDTEDDDLLIISEPRSIPQALEKYDSQYISDENNKIYVNFEKYLYDKDGNSNEKYFKDITEELKPFFSKDFTLIDEEKDIKIKVSVKDDNIKINDIKDFYKKTDGKNYAKVQDVEIVKSVNMYIQSDELASIVMDGMFLYEETLEKLGKEDEIQNNENYTSYQQGKIKVSKYIYSNRIRNIIFSRDYAQEIMSNIDSKTTLDKICTRYGEPAFGSARKGFIGYRTKDVYIFFNNDEVSVYGYSYKNNLDLEKYIQDYLKTKDLELFKTRMIVDYDNYYEYSYNEEEKRLYISYPSLGLEIDIHNNDPKGIKLYQNYYLTEKTEKWVKDGLIDLEPDVDYLEKIEKQRTAKEE